jgi:DNA-binding FrmR family transcriptional regulator
MQVLLQQLVAVHDALHEANHNQGEVFVLQDHLHSCLKPS